MTKKDWIYAAIITFICSLLIFINLAGTSSPQTYFEMSTEDTATVEFLSVTQISDARVYAGIPVADGVLRFDFFDGNGSLSARQDISLNGGTMYTFRSIFTSGQNIDTKKVKISVQSGALRINEIYFIGIDGNVAAIYTHSGTSGYTNLFDEQKTYAPGSHKNEMMFDEVYHARTAYEYINGWEIYETTHPPLGKGIISLGIRIFGMTALGWRIMSAIFGLLTVPLMYIFAKKLFGNSQLAALTAILLLIDGMHLTLSRIATLDAIAGFFMLAMYYLMLCFYKTNIRKEGQWKKALIYLAAAGVTFGFAASIKWTNIYAGLGLLAIFVIAIIRDRKIWLSDKKLLPIYLAVAGGAFILLGGLIYTLSYLPYLATSKEGLFATMWKNQQWMLSYHSHITELHNSQSAWYVWPLNLQGVFFYMNDSGATYHRISMLGTTSMYWFGLFAVLFSACYLVYLIKEQRGREEPDKEEQKKIRTLIFLFCGALAVFVPWIFVPRHTFAYHYYLSVLFMVCFISFVFREILTMFTQGKRICVILLSVFALNFVLSLPALCGYPINIDLANVMFRWMSPSYGW